MQERDRQAQQVRAQGGMASMMLQQTMFTNTNDLQQLQQLYVQQQMQQVHPLESFYPGISAAAGAPRVEREGIIAEWASESQGQAQKTVRLTIPGVASNIAFPEAQHDWCECLPACCTQQCLHLRNRALVAMAICRTCGRQKWRISCAPIASNSATWRSAQPMSAECYAYR